MKATAIGMALLAMVCGAGLATGAQDKGAAQITLYGGKSGPVPFPHQLHQTALGDCNLCHAVFPRKAGSIDALKAENALEKKQVMNKQCLKCHRQMKKENQKTGPTTCKGCHQK